MASRTIPGLTDRLVRASKRHACRLALEDGERSWTYRDLAAAIGALASEIGDRAPDSRAPLVAIYADEPSSAFIGALSTLASGLAYVRLDPRDPPGRTLSLIRSAGCSALVADRTGRDRLLPYLQDLERTPNVTTIEDVADPNSGAELVPVRVTPDALAYVHYTSGERAPRGVMITRSNLTTVLASLSDRLNITVEDRVLSLADPASDLGLTEALLVWEAGARLCCPTAEQVLLPAEFVRDSGITFWCLAPSRAAFFDALGALEPNLFPDLRQTVFAGEPLTADLVQTWSAAAPNSAIESLYGPAEATVACATYSWNPATSAEECSNEVLPIGRMLPGVTALVVDDQGREVHGSERGELVLRGPQVTPGFWQQTEETKSAFLRPEAQQDEDYFRTGDLVFRQENGLLFQLGRIDRQIRVRGFRVELAEVERALSEASGLETIAAIGWPVTARGFDGIVAFVESNPLDLVGVHRELRKRLPRYMVPNRIVALPTLPRTTKHRIDWRALNERMGHPPSGLVG